ncbi:hypothetical protein IL306_005038 [Fusarium sp. DS 682]|nr:hypothetical protein IL306_005038 [Fusarium sp. DS 682]
MPGTGYFPISKERMRQWLQGLPSPPRHSPSAPPEFPASPVWPESPEPEHDLATKAAHDPYALPPSSPSLHLTEHRFSSPERQVISHIIDHQVLPNACVQLKVEWEDFTETWVPEHQLQEDVPSKVYRYWHKKGGREKATGLDEFHVFKILAVRGEGLQKELKCQ